MAQLKRSRTGWIILVALFLILVGALVIFLYLRRKKRNQEQQETNDADEQPELFTPDRKILDFRARVKKVFETDHMTNFVTAQAMHETGIFKSDLFLKDNNAFGMNESHKRQSTESDDISDPGTYAGYASVDDSIQDLRLWMEYVNFNMAVPNIREYCRELKNHSYYADTFTNYSAACSKHLTKLKSLQYA